MILEHKIYMPFSKKSNLRQIKISQNHQKKWKQQYVGYILISQFFCLNEQSQLISRKLMKNKRIRYHLVVYCQYLILYALYYQLACQKLSFQLMSDKKSKTASSRQTDTTTFCLKPRTIRNTPLNKYDLSELQSNGTSGVQITDHFNYGFNSETFPLYGKLCKRFAEVEEIERPNLVYDPRANYQFKFNDDTPIDLGGFGPFLDKQLIDIWQNDDFQNGDSLMDFFVRFNLCIQAKKSSQVPYSLVEFIKLMGDNQQNQFSKIIDELADKISEKYQRTIAVLKKRQQLIRKEHKQNQQRRVDPEQLSTKGEQGKESAFYDEVFGKTIIPLSDKEFHQESYVKIEVKYEENIEKAADDEPQDSIVYSSIEDKEESKNLGQIEVKYEKESDSESEQSKESSKKSSKSSHKEFKPNKNQNYRRQRSPSHKRKSSRQQRSERQKKKKEKSKRIKKHRSHKRHKKHGKKSKKHKK